MTYFQPVDDLGIPPRSSYDIPSARWVCSLAPCRTDGPCPLTGSPCRRPYPWRQTPDAVMDRVITHYGMREAIDNPLTPKQQREQAPARRRVPFTPTIPGL